MLVVPEWFATYIRLTIGFVSIAFDVFMLFFFLSSDDRKRAGSFPLNGEAILTNAACIYCTFVIWAPFFFSFSSWDLWKLWIFPIDTVLSTKNCKYVTSTRTCFVVSQQIYIYIKKKLFWDVSLLYVCIYLFRVQCNDGWFLIHYRFYSNI